MKLTCEAVARSTLGTPLENHGAELLFRCPRHDDQHPSLQINSKKDVWLCGPCSAGGKAWKLAAFLGGCDSSEMSAVRTWLSQHGLLKSTPRARRSIARTRREVAAYPYTDGDGNLLYEKVRYEPKDFAVRRPDGRGGWLWGMGEVRSVLYNIPNLIKSHDVLYVEGEKDVETAKRLGFVATTSGSASSWCGEHAECFDGKDVWIIADSDEPGGKHARRVAADLIGLAKSARVLEMPDTKDLSEWVEHGGTRDALVELLNAATVLTAEDFVEAEREKDKRTQQGLTVSELLEQAGLNSLQRGGSIEALEESLRRLAASAFGADAIRRAALRTAAIARLADVGVNSPAKLVDAALKDSDESGTARGQEQLFADLEPWPDPVDGSDLLSQICQLFRRFSVIPQGGATAISLWVLHTYALAAAYISPILAIVSPEKRCGKTVVLNILAKLVWRSLTASNITAASLFRSVEKWTPTLLIDEADTFLVGNDELRGVINSGHRRDSAKVIRTAGDEHEPRVFPTWGAKAIALIGKLPGTLEDRAIVLPMKRKNPNEHVEWFRPELLSAELDVIRRKILRWVTDNLEDLRETNPQVPNGLHDRAADNWRPLLAIADAAGDPWPEVARRDALVLSGTEQTEENSAGVQLLADLRQLFRFTNEQFHSSDDVVKHLCELEERPWAEWKSGKPMTKVQCAALLRKFDIRPRQPWIGGRPVRGYTLPDFKDAFSRYLPSESVGSVEPNTGAGLSDIPDSVGKESPTDPEKQSKGPSIKESTDPTDPKAEQAAGEAQVDLDFMGDDESALAEPDYGEA